MPCPRCEAPLLGDPSACPECGQPLKATARQSPGLRQPSGSAVSRPSPPPQQTQARAQAQAGLRAQPAAAARQGSAARPVAPPLRSVDELEVAPVEGLIDSRLFGAFVPKNIEAPPLEGLETTAFEAGQEVNSQPIPGLVVSDFRAQPSTNEPVEVVPGLIDARLFGAYVPEGVDAPPIEGLETTALETVRARPSEAGEKEHDSAKHYHCHACGYSGREPLCPDCGQPTRPRSLD